ncbi:MAG: 2Fe-2S iron-sulfur cluster-binding protein [Myxococcota bacterium]|nr:2Fe-2S iron-sulfur cluster-binding protein [Myxococcota bacterium]
MSEDERHHHVVFIFEDQRWETTAAEGESILTVAQRCGAPVQTLCNGIAACIQCKVRILEGHEHLSAPDVIEKDRLGNIFHITGERLGCQTQVHGDVVLEPLAAKLPKRRRRGPTRRRP